jgi:hypothetical protein
VSRIAETVPSGTGRPARTVEKEEGGVGTDEADCRRGTGREFRVVEAQERRRGHLASRTTTLSGRRDDEFVADAGDGNEQELRALLTGNYKRGNERDSQKHPRNRGRS